VTYFLNHVVFITNYIAINTAYLCNTALMLGYYFKDGLTGGGEGVHPLDAGQRGVLFFMIKQKIIETK
jgi:hypothetical protein